MIYWKQKFSNNQIFNNTASGSKNTLNVFVNGIKIPSGTNYRDIAFHAHDAITIVYGKPPNFMIPTKYNFGSL